MAAPAAQRTVVKFFDANDTEVDGDSKAAVKAIEQVLDEQGATLEEHVYLIAGPPEPELRPPPPLCVECNARPPRKGDTLCGSCLKQRWKG